MSDPLHPVARAHAVDAAVFGIVTTILAVGVNFAATPAGAVFLFGLAAATMIVSVVCWVLMVVAQRRVREADRG